MPLNPGAVDLLASPAAPTVVQNALGAGAAISYAIVAVNGAGQDSIPSAAVTTPANNASTANNTISWVAIPAATGGYRVLKNGALLASVAAGTTTYTDSAGASTATYVAATANPAAMVPSVVSPIDGGQATYSFSIVGLAPASSPTDIFNITGSASKTIKITRLIVSALQTTAGSIDVLVIKRSGGTQSAGTSGASSIVSNDTNNPTASALVQTYTSNPGSVGTSLGNIFAGKVLVTAAATTSSPDKVILDYGNRPAQAQVLRGTTQSISVNLNGVTLTGGSVDVFCEWSEL
jgi:hypothetical protein